MSRGILYGFYLTRRNFVRGDAMSTAGLGLVSLVMVRDASQRG